MDDDRWGCVVWAIILAGGAWWFWNKFEIRQRNDDRPPPIVLASPVEPVRPSGMQYVTTLEGGTVWSIDADSVIGPRSARQGWLKADHSKDKEVSARETQYLYRVNCDTTAYRTLKAVEYDKDGSFIRSWDAETFSDKDDYPTPDSNMAAVIAGLCDEGFNLKGR